MSATQTEQTQSNPMIFVCDTPGGSVRFENTSDTIFANLFLPLNDPDDPDRSDSPNDFSSIPWQFCDRLLRALRDPRFKPMDITFRDCSDMFRCVGDRRHDAWSEVEARPTCNASFPLVVLDGVLECMKAEMLSMVSRMPIEERYFKKLGHWIFQSGEEEDLQNMMLVHSSWHASVKRLVGYGVVSSARSLLKHVQNPTFDIEESESGGSMPSPQSIGQYVHFLGAFCSRIPNTRLAHLSLPEFSGLELSTIGNVLLSLVSLEDLAIEVGTRKRIFSSQATRAIAAIAEILHPALRSIRLYAKTFECDDPSNLLQPLNSLPKLQSVQLIYPDTPGTYASLPSIALSNALWSRDTCQRGSQFALSDVQIDCTSESSWADSTEFTERNMGAWLFAILRVANVVRFRIGVNCLVRRFDRSQRSQHNYTADPDLFAQMIGHWLKECSSARTLIFQGLPWARMEVFEYLQLYPCMLANVEELVVELSPLPLPITPSSHQWSCATDEDKELARETFSRDEIGLSRTVRSGLFPGLRALKAIIPREGMEVYISGFEDPTKQVEDFSTFMPICKQKCAESSVKFRVEIA
ncbi:hypothetical protein SCHPADRAFT_886685 [Schizopora paradoxa]|uniref:Uncharacterized protein n=1 Tax=Schizopora paradoxa TaxID=27342 RepID=A0A0H2SLA0_9AGAM|nr:hypothetical protein SCHPADRAFT_886685 [Schizopora paradoxa]